MTFNKTWDIYFGTQYTICSNGPAEAGWSDGVMVEEMHYTIHNTPNIITH